MNFWHLCLSPDPEKYIDNREQTCNTIFLVISVSLGHKPKYGERADNIYTKVKVFMTTKALCVMLPLLVALFAGCAKTDGNGTLVVGMELAYPPFETKDKNGDPSGVSVDFSKEFAQYIGKAVRIENIAWAGLIPSLQTDKIDMVISSMTIRDDRLKEVDFSDPYANALLAILSSKSSGIASVDDLNQTGRKIAIKNGTTGHFYAQDNLTNAELVVLEDESACVMEVSQGKADGFIYDQLTIYRNWQNNLETTSALFIPFQNVEKWGVAVKKGNTELLSQLNEFIKKYSSEGGFDQLTQKYLSDEKKAFDELGFAWFFDLK